MSIVSSIHRAVRSVVDSPEARIALFRKAVSFAAIGFINAAVDFGIFVLAYRRGGLPLVSSNILSWTVAASGSYVMNSFITFAAESGRTLSFRAYAKFLASGVLGLVGNTATLLALSYVVPVLLAKVAAIGVSFLINFTMSNFVVFRVAPDEATDPR